MRPLKRSNCMLEIFKMMIVVARASGRASFVLDRQLSMVDALTYSEHCNFLLSNFDTAVVTRCHHVLS